MKNLKNKFILASAILALASCADNSYLGEQEERTNAGGTISFGFDLPTPTRASDGAAATALNNQFIVWGEKNETQTGAGSAPTEGNLVFPNYIVRYTASTANTTTSNTNNWEYVGFKFDDSSASPSTENYATNITPNTKPNTTDPIPAQTIKYWDNAATSYTFTAVSAKPADISAGRVKITKNQTGTNNVYEKGYTVTLAKNQENNADVYPSLSDLYFADRINIAKGANGYTPNAVQFNFRNSLSQIRAGIYETVPGYNISSIKFYVNNTDQTPTQTVEAKVGNDLAFGAVCDNTTTDNFEGTITVTYYSTGTDVNKPILTVAPGTNVQKSNLILGTNLRGINATTTLSETASTPSWDQATGAYTAVLPQATTNPLKLKCDYTLYNPTTKETINITGKTAEIPALYLQWKANFKYSYIFKITDDDLNPITFDAVVITNELGNAEYITTVTEPSITTFGVTSTGVYSTGKDEYVTGTDIYATFMKGSEVQTPSLSESTKANYVQIYQVTTADATNFPITEASVANSIANSTGNKITCTNVTTSSDGTYFNSPESPSVEPTVPAEDGTTKTINAVKLPGAKTNTYAIEYVTYDAGTVLTTEQSKVGYYVESSGVYTKQNDGNGDGSTKYYKQIKTYKVIKVVAN